MVHTEIDWTGHNGPQESKPYGRLAHKGYFNPSAYDIVDKFETDTDNPRTSIELLGHLHKNPQCEIDARVLSRFKNSLALKRLDRKAFLEAWNDGGKKLKEAFDAFGTDALPPFNSSIVGGPDFIPLLGGPFYKQQYYYDYIRGHQQAFYAYHHDPIARAVIHITRDFTLGRDWKVTSDNKGALALWEAFAEVNDLPTLMDTIAVELSDYGEEFIWWLPNNLTKISFDDKKGQMPPKGILPRVRTIDPSCIWEIVTYPEDITRVLWYQWVAPTQYQTYTGSDKGQVVPSTKFIFQQVPAEQVMHFKVNSMSNEKRGRSDLYPVLGYLKRLRDTVEYSIISLQKQAAWSIDTTIEGNQQDIDNYIEAQKALGIIPPAGSEFVHTSKVTRQHLSNEGGARGQNSSAFDWALSMVAAGTGIPVQYFGTHLSGAQTRASALVATEPVAKKFESRQQVYRRIIKAMAKRLFEEFNVKADIEVMFPEIVVQDRSAKLKDLAMAEGQGWISNQTAAVIAGKELQVHDYDYKKEQQEITQYGAVLNNPLTTDGTAPVADENPNQPSGMDSAERRRLSMTKGM